MTVKGIIWNYRRAVFITYVLKKLSSGFIKNKVNTSITISIFCNTFIVLSDCSSYMFYRRSVCALNLDLCSDHRYWNLFIFAERVQSWKPFYYRQVFVRHGFLWIIRTIHQIPFVSQFGFSKNLSNLSFCDNNKRWNLLKDSTSQQFLVNL